MKAKKWLNRKWTVIWVVIIAFMAFGQQTYAQKDKRTTAKINSSEDLLRKYESFKEVDLIQNKAGISLKVSMFLQATYANPMFKSDDAELCKTKFHLKDAVTLQEIDTNIGAAKVEVKNSNGEIVSTEYGTYFQIRKMPPKTKFIIVCFDGITKTENEELETPPLFFLAQIDQKGTLVLTKTPKLLGDLLKSE